jgi:hypothetical protein
VSTFAHDEAEISAAVGLPLGSKGGFASSILLLLSDKQCPLADRIELWECEPQPLTVAKDSPRANIKSIQTICLCSRDTDRHRKQESESWQQAVCDRIAESRIPELFESSEIGQPFGVLLLAIPVFHLRELAGILNFMFLGGPSEKASPTLNLLD